MKNETFIIAEAGINHNGSIELAKKMIETASDSGADAIKFQTFKAENLVSKIAPKATYQKRAGHPEESQFEMLKKYEFTQDEHKELISYCEKTKIIFLSSPFDMESIDFLKELGMNIFKIPSGETTNLPYLRKIGSLRKKIILSTGMAEMDEIREALEVLTLSGTDQENITVLHCNTEYPTPMEDVNLLAMQTIEKEFNVRVGYSDHTLGIEIPIAAVAMGAKIIEKHFTLDKNMEGPDHKASLEPYELKAMVTAIRNIEIAMGNGIKKPSPSELKNKPTVRKSIVAARDVKKGEIFSEENIIAKRPGTGISPMRWDDVVGKMANKDYKQDEPI